MHVAPVPPGQIAKSVGPGQPNQLNDVSTVQGHLIRHAKWLLPLLPPAQSGKCDTATIAAIKKFQEVAISFTNPDGIAGAHGLTIKFLAKPVILGPQHRVFLPVCWDHPDNNLSDAALKDAAGTLKCDVPAIQAVAQVETKRAAWDEFGRPSILFERSLFARLTHRVYSATSPDISHPHATGEYGKFAVQYPKLYRAAMLDEPAALKATSWGTFQILGNNFGACGAVSVEAFVSSMLDSMVAHLQAFVAFISSSVAMQTALRKHDWATFARHYNGPNYAINHYDTNLAAAYRELTANLGPPKPDQGVPKVNAGSGKK